MGIILGQSPKHEALGRRRGRENGAIVSGPDGLEERTACADEALEAAFEQMDIDEAEADNYSEDPEQWSNDND